MMPVSAKEEVLLDAFRRLPPDAAAELSALAQRLAAVAPDTTTARTPAPPATILATPPVKADAPDTIKE
jgi:hypothetical protein